MKALAGRDKMCWTEVLRRKLLELPMREGRSGRIQLRNLLSEDENLPWRVRTLQGEQPGFEPWIQFVGCKGVKDLCESEAIVDVERASVNSELIRLLRYRQEKDR